MNKIGLVVLVSLLFACKKHEVKEVDESSEEYIAFRHPDGFPQTAYPINERPIDPEKFKVGRDLFYSPILSSDNTISCASCHSQTHMFGDHNVQFSAGVNGALGLRNTPAIINLAWQPHFNWDGGVNHLEVFSLAPITNTLEMNETIPNVLQKLNSSPEWKLKFKKAFGVDTITDYELFLALTQYMLRIISDNSHYDKVKRGEATFTTEQQAGYTLYQNNCAACHVEPLFTDYSFRNNGLEMNYSDQGRFTITNNQSDLARFKVPTLRNVLHTYPYMHDGRFTSIDQVLEHYNSGVQPHQNLDPLLVNGITLSATDKLHLKRFLETLIDVDLMGDAVLSEP